MDEPLRRKALVGLRRVEGQVRGLARMIEDGRYCIEIVTQVDATRAALSRVSSDLLRNHVERCVQHAIRSGKPGDRRKVMDELTGLLQRR